MKKLRYFQIGHRAPWYPYYSDMGITHYTSCMWGITWKRGDKKWGEKKSWIYGRVISDALR